jgi:chaperone modulatory protein CbpM
MIALDEVLARLHRLGLDRHELGRWVENRWVLAERHGDRMLFREVDVARIELIQEIRRDFAVDDEAVPLVLGLLDQVYELRRQLRRLCDALASQPDEVQEGVRQALPRVERRQRLDEC